MCLKTNRFHLGAAEKDFNRTLNRFNGREDEKEELLSQATALQGRDDQEEIDEEELLRKAIALSLEEWK